MKLTSLAILILSITLTDVAIAAPTAVGVPAGLSFTMSNKVAVVYGTNDSKSTYVVATKHTMGNKCHATISTSGSIYQSTCTPGAEIDTTTTPAPPETITDSNIIGGGTWSSM